MKVEIWQKLCDHKIGDIFKKLEKLLRWRFQNLDLKVSIYSINPASLRLKPDYMELDEEKLAGLAGTGYPVAH